MFYVVNNHLNNLYVLSNKAVGPGKNPKLINVGPTSIPEARVTEIASNFFQIHIKKVSTALAHVKQINVVRIY